MARCPYHCFCIYTCAYKAQFARKSLQKYYFFSIWPNIFVKKCKKSDFFFKMQGLGSKLSLTYSQKESLARWTKGVMGKHLFSEKMARKVYNTKYYIVNCMILPFSGFHPMMILWFRSYFELKFFRCASCNALEIAVEGGVTPLVAVRMMRLMPWRITFFAVLQHKICIYQKKSVPLHPQRF